MAKKIEIKVPDLGESIVEAIIASWLKKKGETVKKDEPIIELETDKVTLEVMSPCDGVLMNHAFHEGEVVNIGQVLGVVKEGGLTTTKDIKKGKKMSAQILVEKKRAASSDFRVEKSGPSVRKIVREKGIETREIKASGKEGRLKKSDILEAMQTIEELQTPVDAPVSPSQKDKQGREERLPMSILRQRIAERLKASQNTAVMLTTFNEIDMTASMAMRKKYKELFEKKHGVKLGFMSMFTHAVVHTLKEIPALNAEIDGKEIVYKYFYNIGIAVGTEKGLVVPVINNADQLSMADIERLLKEKAQRAREGKLAIEDIQGGTFTISNGGIYGSMLSTPIINPPQTGIIGLHNIQNRPVAIENKVEIRPMMYVALSYDHRLVDGKEAVTFLIQVKKYIEDPERMLLDF